MAEGVACAPQSVTLAQTLNLTRGKTGASCLAKHFGDEVVVVDMGVNAVIRDPKVLDRKLAMGTRDLDSEPATDAPAGAAGDPARASSWRAPGGGGPCHSRRRR